MSLPSLFPSRGGSLTVVRRAVVLFAVVLCVAPPSGCEAGTYPAPRQSPPAITVRGLSAQYRTGSSWPDRGISLGYAPDGIRLFDQNDQRRAEFVNP